MNKSLSESLYGKEAVWLSHFFKEENKMNGMLVLGVNVGEYVQIGDDIKVCVMKHKNDSLRLSIIAPKDIKILRSAVIEKDRRAAEQAARLAQSAQPPLVEPPARLGHLAQAARP